jgi:hypothetical protein
MTYLDEDSVITEVRKNRSELMAEFDGDAMKLIEHLRSERPKLEASGWRYESEEEFEARKTWHRNQQEAEQQRMQAI